MDLRRVLSLAAVLVCSLSQIAYGDDPKPGGMQTGIGYSQTAHCDSKIGLADLGVSFFGSGQGLQEILDGLFESCAEFRALNTNPHKVVLFLAKPTAAAQQGTVAHFIYHHANPVTPGWTTLPGITSAAWVYITEDDQDTIVSQLTTTASDNPIFSQLGSLASAVGGKIVDMDLFAYIEGGAVAKATTPLVHKLRLLVAKSVDLKAQRGSIAEADYISSPKRDEKGQFVDKDGKPSKTPVFDQISGSFSVTNTPRTWLTVNAGVGFFVGKMHGQRMKVDNKAYASDPLPVGLSLAGATFHFPYNSSDPQPSWRERTGFFVSGVLTPAGGIATGFSIGARGISLTLGYAVMRIDTAPAGKAPGNAVDADVSPQLVKSNAHSWFFGASYSLK
jgi:hypothetical protein